VAAAGSKRNTKRRFDATHTGAEFGRGDDNMIKL